MNKILSQVLKFSVLGAVVALAFPELSFAATAGSIGSSFRDFYTADLANVPKLVSGVAYVGGSVLAFSGALKLKAHAENPANTPMAHGIGRLLAGGGLAALPTLLGTASDTAHLGDAASYDSSLTL